jgi:predicted CXXCH cytochrome family protein
MPHPSGYLCGLPAGRRWAELPRMPRHHPGFMKNKILAAFSLCALLMFAGGLFVTCSTPGGTLHRAPEIEGAHAVGNQACATCHAQIANSFPGSAHGRMSKDDLQFATLTGCESCHGPASRHVEVGGGRQLIANPGKNPSICLDCHIKTHAEFRMPHHHPVPESRMSCVDCHDPHGHDIHKPAGGLAMARENQSCAQCHAEQTRPFVFEHEALREGCASCHNPHGSINRMFLTERDNNLCLKCHTQLQGPDVAGGDFLIGKVSHAGFMQRGSCWAAGCHTEVHGSNVHPKMLY